MPEFNVGLALVLVDSRAVSSAEVWSEAVALRPFAAACALRLGSGLGRAFPYGCFYRSGPGPRLNPKV